MKRHSYNYLKGSALLGVYWTIAILSLAVFTTTQFLHQEISYDNSQSSFFEAKQMAISGADIACASQVSQGDGILDRVEGNRSWSVVKVSEGGRFPINNYLTTENRKILEDLFELLGLDERSSHIIVDEMIDWVDGDSRETGEGKEIGFYAEQGITDYPFNRPFSSLREVSLINSFNLLAASVPDWDRFFTVDSSGRVDLNAADAKIIAAVCECSLATAEKFVRQRSGSDGIPFTKDDFVFESMEEALSSLETGTADQLRLEPRLSLSDSTIRIISIGSFFATSVKHERVIRGSRLVRISEQQYQ